jgi:VIT1/CCC1 family predicted Fe2+/Mn2+ transporter/rubrerythrin
MNIAQSLENLRLEQDAIALYDALATIDRDPRRAAAFRHIAANERRHADIWASRLRELGATVPPPARPRARVRFIILAARLLGTRAVSDLVKSLEGDEVEIYDAQDANPEIESIAADEREHAEIWKRLDAGQGHEAAAGRAAAGEGSAVRATGGNGAAGEATARDATAPEGTEGNGTGSGVARPVRASAASEIVTASPHPAAPAATRTAPEAITRGEGWHRSARSGTLRAVIFGVSDGLVSNLSLVMGVAGASTQDQFILMAGIAGLLAGAFSMAAGEYISMQSQRELFERQIALERAELEAMPEDEQRELATIYAGKGVPRADAERLAAHMFEDPEVALDTLVREELGLDPDELGSPWGAAGGSFAAFAVGAAVPVVPYLVATGTAAFVISLGLSLVALFVVGALVSLLTGRGVLFSGLRQVGIGAAAATVTYLVGRVIGVGVAG